MRRDHTWAVRCTRVRSGLQRRLGVQQVSVSPATCEVNEESSSSLSSPGNPAAEVNELFRALPVPVRMPGLLPGSEGLAIQLGHLVRDTVTHETCRFAELSGRGGKHGPNSRVSYELSGDSAHPYARVHSSRPMPGRKPSRKSCHARQADRYLVAKEARTSEVRATTAGSGLGLGLGSPATPGWRCATSRDLDPARAPGWGWG